MSSKGDPTEAEVSVTETVSTGISEGGGAAPVKPSSSIVLSKQQQEAKDLFINWYNDEHARKRQPVFVLAGYAGTGKSFTTKSIIEEVDGDVLFGAYTGKAALIMRRNGNGSARTLHSLIYKPVPPSKELADQLDKDLQAAVKASDSAKVAQIKEELKKNSKIRFELNEESELAGAALLVLDECSMVNDEMLADLLSFNVPILALGDPGQLPPIDGTGALFKHKPDYTLTEIRRQAMDNPIINLSMKARNGVHIAHGDFGKARIINKHAILPSDVRSCDQIITGKNLTRMDLNRRFRRMIGKTDTYPEVGERIICLRNNSGYGILNGLQCEVIAKVEEYDDFIEYKLLKEDGGPEIIVPILRAHFDEYVKPGTVKELKWWDRQKAEEFDFGYAITVHKAQGSQWNKVLFFDDGFFVWDKPQRCKWLYTGITRAADELIIAK
jgi:exodeoxyribonuclease-5